MLKRKIFIQIVLVILMVVNCHAARVLPAFEQFFDGDGDPLSGGKAYFTVSGTNATDKDTFSDSDEQVPNTNPVILDAEGRCPDVFGTGAYRVTLFDFDDVQISQKDPVSSTISAGGFPAWNGLTVYNAPDIVVGDDLNFYRSLVNTNEGNDPITSLEYWEQIEFTQYYNVNKTYQEFDYCTDLATGIKYRSLVADNIGNTPASSPTQWFSLEASVETNASDISTNTGNISTNAGNISTNTGNISTNASGISTVDDKYLPQNAEKLLLNDTTASPGSAYIGRGYQGEQYYGRGATEDQNYGFEAIGGQSYGEDSIGKQHYGRGATDEQYYGRGATAGQYYGHDSTGIIGVGSALGSHATKTLISGSKSATFEGIIDASASAPTIAVNTGNISTNAGNISTNAGNISTNAGNIAVNTAKVGITPTQASEITVNTAKVGITPTQASEITANASDIDALEAENLHPTLNSEKLINNNSTEELPGSAHIGREYKGTQEYGYYAAGPLRFGHRAQDTQLYGYLATGDQYYGGEATGVIEFGSTQGTHADKTLISGIKSATLEEVIDVANLGLQVATFTETDTTCPVSTTTVVNAPTGYTFCYAKQMTWSAFRITSINSTGKAVSFYNASTSDPGTARVIWKIDRW